MVPASALLGAISVGSGLTSYFSLQHAENLRCARRNGDFARGAISSSDVQTVVDRGIEYRVVGASTKSSELIEMKKEWMEGTQVVTSTRSRRTELIDSTQRRFFGQIFLRSEENGEETMIDTSLYSKIPMQTLVSRYTPVGGREQVINQSNDQSGSDEARNRVVREKERVMGAKTEIDGVVEGHVFTVVGQKVPTPGKYGGSRIQAGVISVVSPHPIEQLISEAQSTADVARTVSLVSAGLSLLSGAFGIPKRE